jgi:hypothetical protein
MHGADGGCRVDAAFGAAEPLHSPLPHEVTSNMRRAFIGGLILAALGVAGMALAAKKAKEQVWTDPGYPTSGVDRIALVPVASFDNNLPNENLVETVLGQTFRSTGYRWISGTATRDLLRGSSGSDSLLHALRDQIVARARIDSSDAPRIARQLNVTGLLCVRIDQWQQETPEWNQAGKPYTTVQLHASLVGADGRLLWTATGDQTGEGPYYDPSTAPTSVNDSGLDRKPVTSQGGPPTFREVLVQLLTRWSGEFPPKPAVPTASAPADSSGATASGPAPAVSRPAGADSAATR